MNLSSCNICVKAFRNCSLVSTADLLTLEAFNGVANVVGAGCTVRCRVFLRCSDKDWVELRSNESVF